MNNAMNVFDAEAELADQDTAGRWFVLAQAGASLQESRALVAFTGSVN